MWWQVSFAKKMVNHSSSLEINFFNKLGIQLFTITFYRLCKSESFVHGYDLYLFILCYSVSYK